jgi:hypothetical protein
VWFHEIFRNDGTPYDPKETLLIKSFTVAAPAGRDPLPVQATMRTGVTAGPRH